MKHAALVNPKPRINDSPGLNNREWIETLAIRKMYALKTYSPGLNNREWIETARRPGHARDQPPYSPGLNNREWIETASSCSNSHAQPSFSRFK